jgi:hypothetical protein
MKEKFIFSKEVGDTIQREKNMNICEFAVTKIKHLKI